MLLVQLCPLSILFERTSVAKVQLSVFPENVLEQFTRPAAVEDEHVGLALKGSDTEF